jgi:hypothetical protein
MSAGVTQRSTWELAAESIVVKLRWFGVVMGYILVQTRTGLHDPWAVRAGRSSCRLWSRYLSRSSAITTPV